MTRETFDCIRFYIVVLVLAALLVYALLEYCVFIKKVLDWVFLG